MNSDELPFEVSSSMKTAVTVLGVCLFVSVLALVGLGAFTAKLYTQKERVPEPIIFEVDKASNSIVRLERGKLAVSQQSLLRSVSLRKYVTNRETINHLDEEDRWPEVRLMSSKKVWSNFEGLMNPKVNKKSPFANKDYQRKVEIITDYPINIAGKRIHRVEFYVTDILKGKTFPTQRYVAIIGYDMSEALIKWSDRFVNIDGIRITDYQVHEA